MAILVELGESLAFIGVVVTQVEQVVGCASFVLLTCIKVVNFSLQRLLNMRVCRLHLLKPCHLSVEILLALIGVAVLYLLEFLLADFLVSHCEVLVEPLLFCVQLLIIGYVHGLTGDEVSRDRVGIAHFCGIYKLMVPACPFLKPSYFDSFFVTHGSPLCTCARHNVVEL